MQVRPALTSLPKAMRRVATVRSKPGATSAGGFPPSSSVTGVILRAAAVITWRPMVVDPVNDREQQMIERQCLKGTRYARIARDDMHGGGFPRSLPNAPQCLGSLASIGGIP
jgi:hypothetical protein